MTIQENELHYYINLLRMDDSEQRDTEESRGCVRALHNIIRTMRYSRHDKICGEDFSRLDFGNIPFNGIHFSLNGEQPCNFTGCALKEWNFSGGHSKPITYVTYSPDERNVVTCSYDGTVIFWDSETGLINNQLNGHLDYIKFIAFSPKGDLCVTVCDDEREKPMLWNVTDGKIMHKLDNKLKKIIDVTFSKDGKSCWAVFNDCSMIAWDVDTGQIVQTKKGHRYLYCDVISSDKKLCLKMDVNEAKIIECSTGIVLQNLKGHRFPIYHSAFSTDQRLCMTGSSDYTAIIWNIATGELIHQLKDEKSSVSYVSFSRDGTKCLTGYDNGNLIIWDVLSGKKMQKLKEYDCSICSSTFSANGKSCVISYENGNTILWDIISGKKLQVFRSFSYEVCLVSFSDNGSMFSTVAKDNSIMYWNTLKGKKVSELEYMNSMKRIPLYEIIPIHRNIIVKDNRTHKELYLLEGHYDKVICSTISCDEKLCLTGSRDHSAIIWSLETGKMLHRLECSSSVMSVAFSSDVKTCLTGADGDAVLWDVTTGKKIKVLSGHSDWINSICYSPDGKTCLTGADDNTAIIFDIVTGKVFQVLKCNRDAIKRTAYSIDGTKCLTLYEMYSSVIWNVKDGSIERIIPGKILDYSYDFQYFAKIQYSESGCIAICNSNNDILTTVYHIPNLYLQGCDFSNIQASRSVKHILHQQN